jgi:hypothetical protein
MKHTLSQPPENEWQQEDAADIICNVNKAARDCWERQHLSKAQHVIGRGPWIAKAECGVK